MRYALLICETENPDMSDEVRDERRAAYTAFQDQMNARGVLLSGLRLCPTSTATTVQVRNGELVVADGPFAETKEQVGGFYLVDCKDLDEAIEVAAKIPAADRGLIEVRPVWEM
jgi:hypothetical protein